MPPELLVKAISLSPSLSLSYSRLLIIGPYLKRLQCFSGGLWWRVGQQFRFKFRFSQTGQALCKPAGGILHGHPVLGALAGRRRCRLHVPPLRLQASHGTAEAHRGCTHGDHDVLVVLVWSSRDTELRDTDVPFVKCSAIYRLTQRLCGGGLSGYRCCNILRQEKKRKKEKKNQHSSKNVVASVFEWIECLCSINVSVKTGSAGLMSCDGK